MFPRYYRPKKIGIILSNPDIICHTKTNWTLFLNLLKFVWWENNVCYAPTTDIYNALEHENFSKENYNVSQIYLAKENPFCNTSVNILEDVLQTSIWMM